MTSSKDPIDARLELLREVSWNRPEHRRQLEERLMREGIGGAKWWG